MTTVTITINDHGATDEPELLAFETAELADEYASARGGLDVRTLDVIGDGDVRRMIEAEIRERIGEERCRRAGL